MIKFCVRLVQRWLPEPFIFAIILTLVAAVLAMPICHQTPLEVVDHWGGGVWNLLAFAMQMSLVLVCGSTLAAAPVVKRGISLLAAIPKTPVAAIALVTAISALACWLNWGFGLIVGVIFAKEIARKMPTIDYRLLIASAYSGFVVWHAGLSGSIPLTMATPGEALTKATNGVLTAPVPISQTILDPHNIVIVLVVMLAIVVTNSLMYPKKDIVSVDPALLEEEAPAPKPQHGSLTPAQRMEHSRLLSWIVGALGFTYLIYHLGWGGGSFDLGSVIMLFLFLGVLLHGTPLAYVHAFTSAAKGAAGIILQFPFYAGIMGIITGVGASGIVPSGGGHWAIQAPIMFAAGADLGVDPGLTGTAIAWGDAWTNLIQPFWAIPALAIAKLDAKDIMGFCLIDLVVTGIVICSGLLIWAM